jgi:hypothetical protein
MKYELIQMLKQGGGIIVNNSSLRGLVGVPGRAANHASKHGILGLISTLVEIHISEKSTNETTKDTLRWVHICISKTKRNLLGNHQIIKSKNLQLYLNEFVYKLNRRYCGDKIFDRLVIANITGA